MTAKEFERNLEIYGNEIGRRTSKEFFVEILIKIGTCKEISDITKNKLIRMYADDMATNNSILECIGFFKTGLQC